MALLAAVLVVFNAGPAQAQDAGAKRDENSRKQAAVKEQLALAKASDARVEAEVNRLNQAVAVQSARAAAARQAVGAAVVQVGEAGRQLAETERRTAAARQVLAQRSIDAYVHPSSHDGVVGILATRSFDEAERRQTMLSFVQSRTADVIDTLRATRQDQKDATKALDAARRAAADHAEAEARQTAALTTDLQAQQAARDQLQARIRDLQSEGQALAGQQAQIEALLRARAAAAPAPAPAPSKPAAKGGASAPAKVSGGGFIWPIRGTVTSEFGPRWGSFHPGLDIADPAGTPISAAKGGTVVFAGPNGGYGNFVIIDHGGGFATAYAHQSRLGVSVGQQVAQGETIGYVGSTGFSTGNHLHFEVRVGGSAQNPRSYLP